MSIFSKEYSLRRSKQILHHGYSLFLRRRKNLSLPVQEEFKKTLLALQERIEKKDKQAASTLAKQLQGMGHTHLKKGVFAQGRDLIFALGFALVVAIIIRQVWFEFYEIPTGSMRPTLKEQDLLVVSKTAFGINLPLTTRHITFDPDLVKRGGIFIFTGEDMNIRDVDTLYFYLFPGKKQYVKRLMGKPGDTLYFYGGKIYGIDKEGKEISAELQRPENIEHVPFLRFEGEVIASRTSSPGIYSPVLLQQMNESVARLYLSGPNQCRGEMLAQEESGKAPADYGDLWGFKNFATARLLTKEEVLKFTQETSTEDGLLYLELRHHPTIQQLTLGPDEYGRVRPLLGYSNSLVPLSEAHLRMLFQHLYTSRFIVKNGAVSRYGYPPADPRSPFTPKLPGVPDGTYEFYDGKASQIKWGGVSRALSESHPLMQFDPARVQLLYNLGIEWDLHFMPQSKQQRFIPSRYAYFREGDLYLLNAPVLTKEDPVLERFIADEEKKLADRPSYKPFKDHGPPLKNGELDVDLIKELGLRVPPRMYLALGDNFANSSDSRVFGFVPEGNLRGAPDFIFWPPGSRFGAPNQPAYPFMNLPRGCVWGAALLVGLCWYALHKRKYQYPLKF